MEKEREDKGIKKERIEDISNKKKQKKRRGEENDNQLPNFVSQ